jgi:hypothetical protein
MQKVEALEGKDPSAFKSTTNNEYWTPQWVPRSDVDPTGNQVRINQRMEPNDRPGGRYSVIRRGLVKPIQKRGNTILYAVTPAGAKFAEEAEVWIRSRPDLFAEIVPEMFA